MKIGKCPEFLAPSSATEDSQPQETYMYIKAILGYKLSYKGSGSLAR
jgi:hypothetical protein